MAGPFDLVQHPELDHALIGNNSGIAAQGINFPYNLSFGDTTHGRITAHLGNGLHIHGHQEDFGTQICRSSCCFTAGMAGTNNNNIVFRKHGRKGTLNSPRVFHVKRVY